MNGWSFAWLIMKISTCVGIFFAACCFFYGNVQCCNDMFWMGAVFACIAGMYAFIHALEELSFKKAILCSLVSGTGMLFPFLVVSGLWYVIA